MANGGRRSAYCWLGGHRNEQSLTPRDSISEYSWQGSVGCIYSHLRPVAGWAGAVFPAESGLWFRRPSQVLLQVSQVGLRKRSLGNDV